MFVAIFLHTIKCLVFLECSLNLLSIKQHFINEIGKNIFFDHISNDQANLAEQCPLSGPGLEPAIPTPRENCSLRPLCDHEHVCWPFFVEVIQEVVKSVNMNLHKRK